MADISDATTNTYLLGEKYLNPDHYTDCQDGGDNNPLYAGFDWDWHRFGIRIPMQDQPGTTDYMSFGSAHAGGINMAFCDGSVHSISYSIDLATHRCLANRMDGEVIDANKF